MIFWANSYFILEIFHAKTFKMRYTSCPYNNFYQIKICQKRQNKVTMTVYVWFDFILHQTLHTYFFFSLLTALAFDPLQKIMAIGNRTGKVRVYGRPGVDLEFEHKKEVAVLKIIFVVNTGRLLTATADNAISLVGFFLPI